MAIVIGRLICDYGLVNNEPASGVVWVQPVNYATDGTLVIVPVNIPFTIGPTGLLDASVIVDNVDITPDLYLKIQERIKGVPERSSYIIKPEVGDTNLAIANRYAVGPIQPLPVANTPVDLVDAATILTDAHLGNHFRVTLAGNRVLANPTNPTDGQKGIWEIRQDGTGSRLITLGSQFSFGTDMPFVTFSTLAGKRDFLGAIYRASLNKWDVIAFSKGY